MTGVLADRFAAPLTLTAVQVLAMLCRNASELTYETLQGQVGISRD